MTPGKADGAHKPYWPDKAGLMVPYKDSLRRRYMNNELIVPTVGPKMKYRPNTQQGKVARQQRKCGLKRIELVTNTGCESCVPNGMVN